MSNKSEPWTTEELNSLPSNYHCEILLSDVNRDDINLNELPTDAHIVEYSDNDGNRIDICRSSKMVTVFDLYYDRFGNHIYKIGHSNGKINPRNWKR